MTVREINDFEALAPLRDAWASLHAQTPGACFFQSLQWLEAYWTHFSDRQRLRVLVVEEQGEPVGVVPLVVRSERTKVGDVRFLTYPLDYWGSHYGPISADPLRTLSLALDYLASQRGDREVVELRWVPNDRGECTGSQSLLNNHRLSPIKTPLDPTAVIELHGTWDDYLASRTSKWRNNQRRWERRLGELGSVEYVRYRCEPGGDPRWDLYDQCVSIAKGTWQAAAPDGTTLSDESVDRFLRDAHRAAAEVGAIDLNLLYLEGRPVAFAYNYAFRGHVFGLRIGYDPGFKKTGVGNVLYARAIEDSFARGDWRYDLGPRHLDIKRHLLTDIVPLHRLSCFPRWSPRHQLLRLKRLADAKHAHA